MSAGLILFGHGARDPQWAEPMRRVAALVRSSNPGLRVELAFLEFIAPTLPDAIDLLAPECGRITVVPMFVAQAGHHKRDVPELLRQARERHPSLSVELAPPFGESDDVLAAIAGYAVRRAQA